MQHCLLDNYKIVQVMSLELKLAPFQGSQDLHRDILEKPSKIFLLKNIRPKAKIFGMLYCLVDSYKVCSNHCTGVKIGPAPGSHFKHRIIQQKHLKIFLSQTARPRHLRYLVDICLSLQRLFKSCPWCQNWLRLRCHMFHIKTNRKTVKILFEPKCKSQS